LEQTAARILQVPKDIFYQTFQLQISVFSTSVILKTKTVLQNSHFIIGHQDGTKVKQKLTGSKYCG